MDGTPSKDAVAVSVIVPLYNEVENLSLLIEELRETLLDMSTTYEIALVDDGSADGTDKAIAQLASTDPRIRPVFLARNYGQSTAMQAGFDHTTGELVVYLDGDMQNDPKDIQRMIRHLQESGADIVSGWRRERQDPALRKLFSAFANRIISRFSRVHLHDYGCSLKVYRREILERVRIHGELHRFVPAMAVERGAAVEEIVVGHRPRRYGTSKYSFDRTFRVMFDLLLILFLRKYVQRPLHFFGLLGLASAVPGGCILFYLLLLKLFTGADIGDRPLLLLGALLVIMGVTMLGQGILGEVMARILLESSHHPQYFLRQKKKVSDLLDHKPD